MPRAIWSGAISFGLVSVPVRMYAATESKELRFHFLTKDDLQPIGYDKVRKDTGQHVDPDDIVRIYTAPGAPSSCMSHSKGAFDTDEYHPVYVYGAGDLALAYLERRGKIIARALCWPEKKVVGRRYGDIDRLQDRLVAEGWQLDSNDSSASGRGSGLLDGARLLRIQDGDCYVMPYIDAGYGVCYPPSGMPDREKYFVLSRFSGDIDCTNTNGLSGERDSEPDYDYHCDACGDGLYEDDAYSLGDDTYCLSHYEDRSRTCYQCECTVHRNCVTIVEDEYYCDTCYGEHTTSCDACSDRTADPVNILDARYDEGEIPSDIEAEVCSSCADNDDDYQQDHNGYWIAVETAQQCSSDTCETWFSADASVCPRCQTEVPAPASENDNTPETQEVEQVA